MFSRFYAISPIEYRDRSCSSYIFALLLVKNWQQFQLLRGYEQCLRRVRKIAKCEYYLRHAYLSVRPHGTTRLPQDGFSWNLIFEDFSKFRWENSSFIKIWQENGHFTERPIYIFDHMPLNSSHNEKYFGQKLFRKSEQTFYVQKLFPKIEPFMR